MPMTAELTIAATREAFELSRKILSALNEPERVFLINISEHKEGDQVLALIKSQLLLCEGERSSYEFALGPMFGGVHQATVGGKRSDFSLVAPGIVRLLSEISICLGSTRPITGAIATYAKVLATVEAGGDPTKLRDCVEAMVEIDIGCAAHLHRMLCLLESPYSSEVAYLVVRRIVNMPADAGQILDMNIGLNRLNTMWLSNLVGLSLDVMLMRGHFRVHEDIAVVLSRIERSMSVLDQEGIRSHATRILLVADIASRLRSAVGEGDPDRRNLLVVLPAWGERFIRQAFDQGIRQLCETWRSYSGVRWSGIQLCILCPECEEPIATALSNELEATPGLEISVASFDERLLAMNKNFMMSSFGTASMLCARLSGYDVLYVAADVFFREDMLYQLDNVLTDRAVEVVFHEGSSFSKEILALDGDSAFIPKNRWHKYLGERLGSLELDFVTKIHSSEQPSKLVRTADFAVVYHSSPSCCILTNEALTQLILPHWYNKDGWFFALLEALGIVDGVDCLATVVELGFSSLDPAEGDWAVDEHHRALVAARQSSDTLFERFRKTRKAHRFTPSLCRCARVPGFVREPTGPSFAEWHLQNTVYQLAMELVELEAEDRTFWGIPYRDAVAAAQVAGNS
jgi:hypothetical protein